MHLEKSIGIAFAKLLWNLDRVYNSSTMILYITV